MNAYKIFSSVKLWFAYRLPPCIWAGLIFYLSSIPSLESGFPGAWDWILRKTAHVFMYAVLTWLIFRALYYGYGMQTKKALPWAVLLALLYAFSDELHQHFVPGRHGRLRDVAVDAIGVFLPFIFFSRAQPLSRKFSGSSSQAH